LKKAGIKTVDVNDDFARLGQDLQRSFIERQDRLVKSRQRVAFVKDMTNTSLKIIKDLVKTRGEWVPARVKELEATSGKLKDWVANTWGAVKSVDDVATDAIRNAGDFLYDISHSNENSARRYAQKTVVAQRRREYINAIKQGNDPLEDWMADTYTTQGRRGTHTRNTVFDNTDPWDYRHYGPQQSGQQHNQTQQQQRQQTQQQTRQQTQQQQQQTQQQTTSMSIETLIRDHVASLRDSVLRRGGESRQNNELMLELGDILDELRSLQNQVPNSTTSTHAAVVQDNITALLTTVDNVRNELQKHMHDQGKDLVDANRKAEKQLVDLVHGFHNQVSILGVVIFDSVNDLQNNFTVSSSAIRDVDYHRFTVGTITVGNNNTNRIDETWVRPEGTDSDGMPNVWGVYLPASGTNSHANLPSAVLTCSMKRSIADMWRGYGQRVNHASYWDAVRSSVTINVRFCIPLEDTEFARAIDNAYANNSTNVTYNFTSAISALQSTSTVTHTHTITIDGKMLSDLYTSIRNAVRNNQALAPLYPSLRNP